MESACNVYISQISIRIVLPTDVIAMLKRHNESNSAYLRYPLEGADDERTNYLYCKVIGGQTRAG